MEYSSNYPSLPLLGDFGLAQGPAGVRPHSSGFRSDESPAPTRREQQLVTNAEWAGGSCPIPQGGRPGRIVTLVLSAIASVLTVWGLDCCSLLGRAARSWSRTVGHGSYLLLSFPESSSGSEFPAERLKIGRQNRPGLKVRKSSFHQIDQPEANQTNTVHCPLSHP